MTVLGAARAPIGYVEFCQHQSEECRPYRAGSSARISLTAERLSDLETINAYVNTAIAPVTDMDLYKTVERWVYPTSEGDCEDYVLLKRRLLIDAGWDESALLITVVRDEKGDGHAVLTVATDRGDLILDNQDERILPWQNTPYSYVKRQSQADPNQWVFVGPADAATAVASTR